MIVLVSLIVLLRGFTCFHDFLHGASLYTARVLRRWPLNTGQTEMGYDSKLIWDDYKEDNAENKGLRWLKKQRGFLP